MPNTKFDKEINIDQIETSTVCLVSVVSEFWAFEILKVLDIATEVNPWLSSATTLSL